MKPTWWSIPAFCMSLAACTCLPKGSSDMDVGAKERGIASWYGAYFHGWLTASGEIYDMEALTAAHRTLPLGTMVRITNAANGTQVAVRINDRGPYVNGRILDLSHAAARRLDMVRDGIAPILLEVIGYGYLLPIDAAPSGSLLDPTGAPGGSRLPFIDARESHPGRMIPDVMRERRTRRVADILAADRGVDVVSTLQIA